MDMVGIWSEETEYCDNLNDIFEGDFDCDFNMDEINKEIVNKLNTQEYREIFINYLNNGYENLGNKDIYYIYFLNDQNIINLGECENILRNYYELQDEEEIILYIYKNVISYYKIDIIGLELFSSNTYINISLCKDSTIEYNIEVKSKKDIQKIELYKYNPLSEYYSDNCNYISGESLYDRKKYFNDYYLSLCQKICTFHSYNNDTGIVK